MNISKTKWYNFFLFKESRKYIFFIMCCLVMASYLGVKTPFLISDLSKNYNSSDLFFTTLKLLFINFFLVYVNRVSFQLLINKYVRLLIQNARLSTYTKWIKADDLESDKYPQGEIISRIISDTEAIRELITSGAFGIFIDLSFVLSCLYGFIKLHQFTGLFISGAELMATILLFLGSSLMRDMFMKLRNSQAKVNRVTANVIGGFEQIYYTRQDQYAINKSVGSFDEFLNNQNKVNSMDAFYYAIAESLYPILLSLVVFIFPYSHIVEGALIFAIIDLIQRSISPIKEISGKIANVQRARTGVDRIQNFLNDITIHEQSSDLRPIKSKFKQYSVNITRFEYPIKKDNLTRELFSLNDISFDGHIGELIGIVGLSGSGKSTLLNILSGSLKAPSSKVEIAFDDRVIAIDKSYDYLKEVSLVSQESHIFSETLRFNITMSSEITADFETRFEVFRESIPYLKSWGIAPDDMILPGKLSLGQRQLLAGIRAMYLNKSIVFFDEISSALDPELELALRKMVLLIQQYSLTIIVAHRIETIIGANKILVMENGRVVESGKHADLLTTSQTYQKFIEELSHS